MTPEQRETLENMAAYATARAEWHPSLMDVTDPGWDLDDLVECVAASATWGRRALAILTALTERTCGTCRHGVDGVCRNLDSMHDDYRQFNPDDGCIKGWKPKEGA